MPRRASTWTLKAALVICGLSGIWAVGTTGALARSATLQRVALYVSDGPELIHYELSVDQATLTRLDSLKVPGAIQYAWPAPSGHELYVVWSAGRGDSGSYGATAFDIEPGSGNLNQRGQAVPLKHRPINLTVDRDGTHLLVVYPNPPGLTVFNISKDGGIGSEVKEPDDLDFGIYVHQVRLEPSNHTAIIVTRGNYEHVLGGDGAKTTDPGALKIFNYKDGVLTNRTSIAPGGGIDFNPRHLDFDSTGLWAFVSLEGENKLQVFRLAKDGTPSSTPLFSKDTDASPTNLPVEHRQESGAVHVHPNGRFVYVAGRAMGTVPFQGKQVFAGGENIISVFEINPTTGEPTLLQTADTHGMVPRTFNLDPSGRILVAANQQPELVRDGDDLKTIPASLAVFRIQADGKLSFVQTYPVDEDTQTSSLFWMNIVKVPR
jgi:6-phosphogluconolactonase